MITTADIDALIDRDVQQDPVRSFHDRRLNVILHLLNGRQGSVGSTGPYPGFGIQKVVSTDFTSATYCPLAPAFAGQNIEVFFNEQSRFLLKGTDLPGDPAEVSIDPAGGFTILIPGFNATTGNYHFYAQIAAT